ncbi:putative acyl carrier protein [Cronobacter dublinensis 1210]|uniref:Acyl carrier protein n=1 Tax=Cronobacter dublinensis 1210 TaxID=1208656 RepID=A0ABM9QC89_9ENTR|nr:DUF1493 family protein [Cronobacter dublinensis]ALB65459.1 acyl carrier protein [Cronobacter dublinensis subsp. dublinensis LMG 23823]MDI7273883.1 DUF1493 family protein [Cronobacter dublinensis]CCJ83208.1 putative acyl carrier protein [Cronobacter dublinensis 1210]
MVDNFEKQIYELIRPYAGTYLFTGKDVPLTPETDLDTDLQIDEAEIEDLMDDFFTTFNVDRAGFTITTYFPDSPFSWNIFKKPEPIPVPDFTIGMLIASARAGRWLYE